MDFLEIINAWKIANNPTPQQLKLAKLRGEVCNSCPSKQVITKNLEIGTICGECGCPLSKKIFSPKYNPCPLKKWEEIDKVHNVQKNSTSII
jgi:hypothetical protein